MAEIALKLTVSESTCSVCGTVAPNAVVSASRMWGHGTARPKKVEGLPEWNVSEAAPEGWATVQVGDDREPVCGDCSKAPKADQIRAVAEVTARREEAREVERAAKAKAEAEAAAAKAKAEAK